ncbi:GSCOCG00011377001-RA-CDS, partial [Cotesia congregata]
APLAATAPNQDLEFLKAVYKYRVIDQKLSEAVLVKFENHLWYLSPETAALSFFDKNISSDVKQKMVAALTSSDEDQFDYPKRFIFNLEDFNWFLNKNVDYFISSNSLKFFERFCIDTNFLQLDDSLWSDHPDYLKGLEIVQHLQVVNDSAERAVKLTEEYINTLAKHEDQKQYVLEI